MPKYQLPTLKFTYIHSKNIMKVGDKNKEKKTPTFCDFNYYLLAYYLL